MKRSIYPLFLRISFLLYVLGGRAISVEAAWYSPFISVEDKITEYNPDSIASVTDTLQTSIVDSYNAEVKSIDSTRILSIKIQPQKVLLPINYKRKLQIEVEPPTVSKEDFKWLMDSVDSEIVTLDSLGIVKGEKLGRAIVRVVSKLDSTKIATCEVIVTDKAYNSPLYSPLANLYRQIYPYLPWLWKFEETLYWFDNE